MDGFFAFDQKARKENLNTSDRHLLRLQEAKQLLGGPKLTNQIRRARQPCVC
jgi:hypothetical protein